ncbi:MAG: Nif11 family protein [Anaerolineae bacterium]|nr:Nif11 family protein [Anaerolineae bacterium]
MALETALKFLERIERETTLRQQLYISKPPNIQKLTEFARGKGFVVTADDIADALDQYQEKFITGSVEPLKLYLKGFKRLPSGEETSLAEIESE